MIKIFKAMNVDQGTIFIQGLAIFVTALLAALTTKGFLWLTILVAADLIQAPFTGISPIANLCKKYGLKPGNIFN